jgi:hypothetical protein
VVPRGYVSVVVCGTRLAEQWRATFADEGIEARVAETDAQDADKGACLVAVRRDDLVRANAVITAVTRGQRTLGRRGAAWIAPAVVLGVAAAIVALVRVLG